MTRPSGQSATAEGGAATALRESAPHAGATATGPIFGPPDAVGRVQIVDPLPPIRSRPAVALLTAVSAAASCVIFPDIAWGPLAFVALTPWLVAVCAAERSRFVYFVSFLFGAVFFLVNIRWVRHATVEGYVPLALMYAALFPLAAWPIRHACRRTARVRRKDGAEIVIGRRGWPVALVAPVVWVAFEWLRATVPFGGFPWLLMGHTQYRFLTFIQIADLVGAFGVSFVVVMINGYFADLLIGPISVFARGAEAGVSAGDATRAGVRRSRRQRPVGGANVGWFVGVVCAGTLVYGWAQGSTRHFKPGPRVAVVQQDFVQIVNQAPAQRFNHHDILAVHLDLARAAARHEPRPDLIVLPEAIVSSCFANDDFLSASRAELSEMQKLRYGRAVEDGYLAFWQTQARRMVAGIQGVCDESGVPMIVGLPSLVYRPLEPLPRVDPYNSTFLFLPDAPGPVARYDKQHLVLFGEYVPFRWTWPAVYGLLNSVTPFGREGYHYSLSPGTSPRVFEWPAASMGGRTLRAGTPICYEEIMPYVAREFVRAPATVATTRPEGSRENPDAARDSGKQIDVLIAVSNDGWFNYSSELEQHLSAAVFRAVENRIAVARSVNTGGSGVIYPNGKLHSRVRLDAAQIAKLAGVEAALRKIDELAGRLSASPARDDAIRPLRDRLKKAVEEDYVAALDALGPGFTARAWRMSAIPPSISAGSRGLKGSIADLRGLIEDDLATVRRWRRHPEMAPGYVVDEIKLDDRRTLYTQWGDWFALSLVGLTGLLIVDWSVARVRRSRGKQSAKAMEGRPT